MPLLEFNAELVGLQGGESATILALTPGAVISLKDIAGKSFDVAVGAQVFVGSDREEDFAFLASLRHHWPLQGPGVAEHVSEGTALASSSPRRASTDGSQLSVRRR